MTVDLTSTAYQHTVSENVERRVNACVSKSKQFKIDDAEDVVLGGGAEIKKVDTVYSQVKWPDMEPSRLFGAI